MAQTPGPAVQLMSPADSSEDRDSSSLGCVLVLLPEPAPRGRGERNAGHVPHEGIRVLAFERGTSAPEPLDVHAARMDSEPATHGASRFVLARTDPDGGSQIDKAPWREATLLAGAWCG